MLEIVYNIRLKAMIEKKGLKQLWLAKQIGEDAAVVTGIIRGYRIPTKAQAKRIAQVLGCAIDDIF